MRSDVYRSDWFEEEIVDVRDESHDHGEIGLNGHSWE